MKFDLENGQSVKIEFLLPDYYPTAQPPQWKLVSRIFSFSDEQQAHIQKELTGKIKSLSFVVKSLSNLVSQLYMKWREAQSSLSGYTGKSSP